MLTKAELTEIAERCEKATKGPWESWNDVKYTKIEGAVGTVCNVGEYTWSNVENDAAFIANAREDVPKLLSHIAQQEAEIERLLGIVENEIPCAVCLAPIDHLWKYDDGEVICGKCAEVRRIDENID